MISPIGLKDEYIIQTTGMIVIKVKRMRNTYEAIVHPVDIVLVRSFIAGLLLILLLCFSVDITNKRDQSNTQQYDYDGHCTPLAIVMEGKGMLI
jgi:hypothetical protein